MSKVNTYWVCLLTTCLLLHAVIPPILSAPGPKARSDVQIRQSPLTPSQFALAATRFIVMLPFLPLLMAVPGATGVLMPLFMALQDRLQTIIPNMPNFFRPPGSDRPGSVSNQGGGGGIAGAIANALSLGGNSGGSATSGTGSATSEEANPAPTFFRYKRSFIKSQVIDRILNKLPHRRINNSFKETFDFLHGADDVLNQLTSRQPDCRRQAVCRLHHSFDPDLGSFLAGIMQLLNLERKVEKLDVSDTAKEIMKDVLQAAHTGLFQKDCTTAYSHCTITVHDNKRQDRNPFLWLLTLLL
ncbi:uncharacterized protein LOC129234357 [Uloborus diversus]|uniref:uncharacterized protein LOC129234357 n=1 Tax=Uloborus diversus TaxID=327109 RepID=UPI002409E329|nr:uncharacterized protein LOC129234357 [Uloborus diversus]